MQLVNKLYVEIIFIIMISSSSIRISIVVVVVVNVFIIHEKCKNCMHTKFTPLWLWKL